MWTTLVNSLTDRPENHKVVHQFPPNVEVRRAVSARQTAELEAAILDAVRHYGEATAVQISTLVDTHTEKYIAAVCNRLLFKGKLVWDYKKADKRPRKYWRLK